MTLNIDDRFKGLYLQNGRYKNEFKESDEPIGTGSYGAVFKAKNEIDDKEYAIKKIIISSTDDFDTKIKELKIWAKLDCDYFVQYRSSWVEIYELEEFKKFQLSKRIFINPNTTGNSEDWEIPNPAILHIQMDLCSFTLRDAMNKMNEYFNNPKKDLLSPLAYYISSELLIEILESIGFLHKQIPSIIHRDLKPDNILIKCGVNSKFIKIADFGISTFQLKEDQSNTQLRGTRKYMAPEVLNSTKYDTKVDVYSIGILTQEMFNVDVNKEDIKFSDSIVSQKYEKLIELIKDCLSVRKNERPNCDQMLKNQNLWSINFEEIKSYIENKGVVIDMKREYDIDREFTNNFLQTKFKNYFQK